MFKDANKKFRQVVFELYLKTYRIPVCFVTMSKMDLTLGVPNIKSA